MNIAETAEAASRPVTRMGRGEPSLTLIDRVADWLIATALSGADLETVVRGFCYRLAATGLPLALKHAGFPTAAGRRRPWRRRTHKR